MRHAGHDEIPIVNALSGVYRDNSTVETDRGCALVAAEFLSDRLELLLRAIMERKGAEPGEIKDFLLNRNCSAGQFQPAH